MTSELHPILLYDGHCGLCHGAVKLILKLEFRQELRFASQQSETGQRLLAAAGLPGSLETVVLVREGRTYLRSDAVVQALGLMGGPWPVVGKLLRLFPGALRNRLYDLISRNRLRVFGTRPDTCPLPDPRLAGRFLG